jgi:hypothetical protein
MEVIHEDHHIRYFNLEAPAGKSLSGIELYNLEPNSNVTLQLDNYGEIYTLQINSTKSYASWWNFDVTLTNPNGSIETKNLHSLAPFALKYDLHLQYYWQELNNTIDTSYFDIDLYTGVKPLEAMLNAYNPLQTTALRFSSITTFSSSYYDFAAYAVTEAEFQKQQNNSIFAPIADLTGQFFSWTWDAVLNLISQIPYIGVYLVSILMLTSLTISSIIFYTKLIFIDYSETTFLTFEFFVLSYSFGKSGNFWVQMKRAVNCHIKAIELIINVSQSLISLISPIIISIAQAIQALKPV